MRRFSETRRPHPLGTDSPVKSALKAERRHLGAIRAVADFVIDTSKFNVHELRAHITQRFQEQSLGEESASFLCQLWIPAGASGGRRCCVRCALSAQPAFHSGVPAADGTRPRVAKYIRSFPQTREFISRTVADLRFLLPHYIHEGKSYLTIAFGCTGGQHRSVMIAEDVGKHLRRAGYSVKVVHRDNPRVSPSPARRTFRSQSGSAREAAIQRGRNEDRRSLAVHATCRSASTANRQASTCSQFSRRRTRTSKAPDRLERLRGTPETPFRQRTTQVE